MDKSDKDDSPAQRLRVLLERSRNLRRQIVTDDAGRDPVLLALAEFQSDRLARTYADFQASPRFAQAVAFFRTDLYGPDDFSQRDHDIERIYPLMTKVLSAQALQSITLAIELHALSQELDLEMAALLGKGRGATTPITPQRYADAYRRCNRSTDRLRQIELIAQIGAVLGDVVKSPVLYATVKVARKPASVAGFGELQSFVERGLRAFRTMKDATPFLAAIDERERRIHKLVMAGAPPQEWHEGFAVP